MKNILSGGNYGGYEVVEGVAYLHDENGDVVETITDVVIDETMITINGWQYVITGELANFVGME
jgi:hypothetical protein